LNKHWVLLDTGVEFQPLSFFGYHFYGEADGARTIPDYLHWIQIWDEGTGCVTIDVYYPETPVLGEAIQVLVYINDYKHRVIDWIHGDDGLFSKNLHTWHRLQYSRNRKASIHYRLRLLCVKWAFWRRFHLTTANQDQVD
jgi:hypothetical protein